MIMPCQFRGLQAFEQELSDEEAVDQDDQADKHTVSGCCDSQKVLSFKILSASFSS